MKRAEDAYFKNVNLFDDLPVVFFPSQHQEKVDKGKSDGLISGLFSAAVSAVSGSKSSVSEVFLRALGVRERKFCFYSFICIYGNILNFFYCRC